MHMRVKTLLRVAQLACGAQRLTKWQSDSPIADRFQLHAAEHTPGTANERATLACGQHAPKCRAAPVAKLDTIATFGILCSCQLQKSGNTS